MVIFLMMSLFLMIFFIILSFNGVKFPSAPPHRVRNFILKIQLEFKFCCHDNGIGKTLVGFSIKFNDNPFSFVFAGGSLYSGVYFDKFSQFLFLNYDRTPSEFNRLILKSQSLDTSLF